MLGNNGNHTAPVKTEGQNIQRENTTQQEQPTTKLTAQGSESSETAILKNVTTPVKDSVRDQKITPRYASGPRPENGSAPNCESTQGTRAIPACKSSSQNATPGRGPSLLEGQISGSGGNLPHGNQTGRNLASGCKQIDDQSSCGTTRVRPSNCGVRSEVRQAAVKNQHQTQEIEGKHDSISLGSKTSLAPCPSECLRSTPPDAGQGGPGLPPSVYPGPSQVRNMSTVHPLSPGPLKQAFVRRNTQGCAKNFPDKSLYRQHNSTHTISFDGPTGARYRHSRYKWTEQPRKRPDYSNSGRVGNPELNAPTTSGCSRKNNEPSERRQHASDTPLTPERKELGHQQCSTSRICGLELSDVDVHSTEIVRRYKSMWAHSRSRSTIVEHVMDLHTAFHGEETLQKLRRQIQFFTGVIVFTDLFIKMLDRDRGRFWLHDTFDSKAKSAISGWKKSKALEESRTESKDRQQRNTLGRPDPTDQTGVQNSGESSGASRTSNASEKSKGSKLTESECSRDVSGHENPHSAKALLSTDAHKHCPDSLMSETPQSSPHDVSQKLSHSKASQPVQSQNLLSSDQVPSVASTCSVESSTSSSSCSVSKPVLSSSSVGCASSSLLCALDSGPKCPRSSSDETPKASTNSQTVQSETCLLSEAVSSKTSLHSEPGVSLTREIVPSKKTYSSHATSTADAEVCQRPSNKIMSELSSKNRNLPKDTSQKVDRGKSTPSQREDRRPRHESRDQHDTDVKVRQINERRRKDLLHETRKDRRGQRELDSSSVEISKKRRKSSPEQSATDSQSQRLARGGSVEKRSSTSHSSRSVSVETKVQRTKRPLNASCKHDLPLAGCLVCQEEKHQNTDQILLNNSQTPSSQHRDKSLKGDNRSSGKVRPCFPARSMGRFQEYVQYANEKLKVEKSNGETPNHDSCESRTEGNRESKNRKNKDDRMSVEDQTTHENKKILKNTSLKKTIEKREKFISLSAHKTEKTAGFPENDSLLRNQNHPEDVSANHSAKEKEQEKEKLKEKDKEEEEEVETNFHESPLPPELQIIGQPGLRNLVPSGSQHLERQEIQNIVIPGLQNLVPPKLQIPVLPKLQKFVRPGLLTPKQHGLQNSNAQRDQASFSGIARHFNESANQLDEKVDEDLELFLFDNGSSDSRTLKTDKEKLNSCVQGKIQMAESLNNSTSPRRFIESQAQGDETPLFHFSHVVSGAQPSACEEGTGNEFTSITTVKQDQVTCNGVAISKSNLADCMQFCKVGHAQRSYQHGKGFGSGKTMGIVDKGAEPVSLDTAEGLQPSTMDSDVSFNSVSGRGKVFLSTMSLDLQKEMEEAGVVKHIYMRDVSNDDRTGFQENTTAAVKEEVVASVHRSSQKTDDPSENYSKLCDAPTCQNIADTYINANALYDTITTVEEHATEETNVVFLPEHFADLLDNSQCAQESNTDEAVSIGSDSREVCDNGIYLLSNSGPATEHMAIIDRSISKSVLAGCVHSQSGLIFQEFQQPEVHEQIQDDQIIHNCLFLLPQGSNPSEQEGTVQLVTSIVTEEADHFTDTMGNNDANGVFLWSEGCGEEGVPDVACTEVVASDSCCEESGVSCALGVEPTDIALILDEHSYFVESDATGSVVGRQRNNALSTPNTLRKDSGSSTGEYPASTEDDILESPREFHDLGECHRLESINLEPQLDCHEVPVYSEPDWQCSSLGENKFSAERTLNSSERIQSRIVDIERRGGFERQPGSCDTTIRRNNSKDNRSNQKQENFLGEFRNNKTASEFLNTTFTYGQDHPGGTKKNSQMGIEEMTGINVSQASCISEKSTNRRNLRDEFEMYKGKEPEDYRESLLVDRNREHHNTHKRSQLSACKNGTETTLTDSDRCCPSAIYPLGYRKGNPRRFPPVSHPIVASKLTKAQTMDIISEFCDVVRPLSPLPTEDGDGCINNKFKLDTGILRGDVVPTISSEEAEVNSECAVDFRSCSLSVPCEGSIKFRLCSATMLQLLGATAGLQVTAGVKEVHASSKNEITNVTSRLVASGTVSAGRETAAGVSCPAGTQADCKARDASSSSCYLDCPSHVAPFGLTTSSTPHTETFENAGSSEDHSGYERSATCVGKSEGDVSDCTSGKGSQTLSGKPTATVARIAPNTALPSKCYANREGGKAISTLGKRKMTQYTLSRSSNNIRFNPYKRHREDLPRAPRKHYPESKNGINSDVNNSYNGRECDVERAKGESCQAHQPRDSNHNDVDDFLCDMVNSPVLLQPAARVYRVNQESKEFATAASTSAIMNAFALQDTTNAESDSKTTDERDANTSECCPTAGENYAGPCSRTGRLRQVMNSAAISEDVLDSWLQSDNCLESFVAKSVPSHQLPSVTADDFLDSIFMSFDDPSTCQEPGPSRQVSDKDQVSGPAITLSTQPHQDTSGTQKHTTAFRLRPDSCLHSPPSGPVFTQLEPLKSEFTFDGVKDCNSILTENWPQDHLDRNFQTTTSPSQSKVDALFYEGGSIQDMNDVDLTVPTTSRYVRDMEDYVKFGVSRSWYAGADGQTTGRVESEDDVSERDTPSPCLSPLLGEPVGFHDLLTLEDTHDESILFSKDPYKSEVQPDYIGVSEQEGGQGADRHNTELNGINQSTDVYGYNLRITDKRRDFLHLRGQTQGQGCGDMDYENYVKALDFEDDLGCDGQLFMENEDPLGRTCHLPLVPDSETAVSPDLSDDDSDSSSSSEEELNVDNSDLTEAIIIPSRRKKLRRKVATPKDEEPSEFTEGERKRYLARQCHLTRVNTEFSALMRRGIIRKEPSKDEEKKEEVEGQSSEAETINLSVCARSLIVVGPRRSSRSKGRKDRVSPKARCGKNTSLTPEVSKSNIGAKTEDSFIKDTSESTNNTDSLQPLGRKRTLQFSGRHTPSSSTHPLSKSTSNATKVSLPAALKESSNISQRAASRKVRMARAQLVKPIQTDTEVSESDSETDRNVCTRAKMRATNVTKETSASHGEMSTNIQHYVQTRREEVTRFTKQVHTLTSGFLGAPTAAILKPPQVHKVATRVHRPMKRRRQLAARRTVMTRGRPWTPSCGTRGQLNSNNNAGDGRKLEGQAKGKEQEGKRESQAGGKEHERKTGKREQIRPQRLCWGRAVEDDSEDDTCRNTIKSKDGSWGLSSSRKHTSSRFPNHDDSGFENSRSSIDQKGKQSGLRNCEDVKAMAPDNQEIKKGQKDGDGITPTPKNRRLSEVRTLSRQETLEPATSPIPIPARERAAMRRRFVMVQAKLRLRHYLQYAAPSSGNLQVSLRRQRHSDVTGTTNQSEFPSTIERLPQIRGHSKQGLLRGASFNVVKEGGQKNSAHVQTSEGSDQPVSINGDGDRASAGLFRFVHRLNSKYGEQLGQARNKNRQELSRLCKQYLRQHEDLDGTGTQKAAQQLTGSVDDDAETIAASELSGSKSVSRGSGEPENLRLPRDVTCQRTFEVKTDHIGRPTSALKNERCRAGAALRCSELRTNKSSNVTKSHNLTVTSPPLPNISSGDDGTQHSTNNKSRNTTNRANRIQSPGSNANSRSSSWKEEHDEKVRVSIDERPGQQYKREGAGAATLCNERGGGGGGGGGGQLGQKRAKRKFNCFQELVKKREERLKKESMDLKTWIRNRLTSGSSSYQPSGPSNGKEQRAFGKCLDPAKQALKGQEKKKERYSSLGVLAIGSNPNDFSGDTNATQPEEQLSLPSILRAEATQKLEATGLSPSMPESSGKGMDRGLGRMTCFDHSKVDCRACDEIDDGEAEGAVVSEQLIPLSEMKKISERSVPPLTFPHLLNRQYADTSGDRDSGSVTREERCGVALHATDVESSNSRLGRAGFAPAADGSDKTGRSDKCVRNSRLEMWFSPKTRSSHVAQSQCSAKEETRESGICKSVGWMGREEATFPMWSRANGTKEKEAGTSGNFERRSSIKTDNENGLSFQTLSTAEGVEGQRERSEILKREFRTSSDDCAKDLRKESNCKPMETSVERMNVRMKDSAWLDTEAQTLKCGHDTLFHHNNKHGAVLETEQKQAHDKRPLLHSVALPRDLCDPDFFLVGPETTDNTRLYGTVERSRSAGEKMDHPHDTLQATHEQQLEMCEEPKNCHVGETKWTQRPLSRLKEKQHNEDALRSRVILTPAINNRADTFINCDTPKSQKRAESGNNLNSLAEGSGNLSTIKVYSTTVSSGSWHWSLNKDNVSVSAETPLLEVEDDEYGDLGTSLEETSIPWSVEPLHSLKKLADQNFSSRFKFSCTPDAVPESPDGGMTSYLFTGLEHDKGRSRKGVSQRLNLNAEKTKGSETGVPSLTSSHFLDRYKTDIEPVLKTTERSEDQSGVTGNEGICAYGKMSSQNVQELISACTPPPSLIQETHSASLTSQLPAVGDGNDNHIVESARSERGVPSTMTGQREAQTCTVIEPPQQQAADIPWLAIGQEETQTVCLVHPSSYKTSLSPIPESVEE